MRISAVLAGLEDTLNHEAERIERAITGAMQEATVGLKNEYRDQTFKVLGSRVAYAWQGETFPRTGFSLEPAAYVFTKAPRIISFFSAVRIVTPHGAAFAIPVNPVLKRGGQPMTPVEVEAKYNQELRPRLLPSGNLGLFLDVVRAKSARRPGLRRLTAGRAKQGRSTESILMFVLVRSIRSRKLLDLEGPAQRWAARVPGLIEKRLAA